MQEMTRLFVTLGMVLSVPALAATYVTDGPTPVYQKPNLSSKVLGTLKKGREVEIDRRGRTWIRAILKTKKGKIVGFLHVPREEEEEPSEQDLMNLRVGLQLSYTYYTQSSRTFTDTEGQTDIGNLSGSSTHFGLLLEFPSSWKFHYRAGIGFRQLYMKGTARYRTSLPAADTPVEIKQSFTSIFGGAKYPLFKKFPLWAGAILEIANASKSEVFNTEAEKPTYFIFLPSVGADFFVYRQWWVQPEARIGLILNTKPFVLAPEFVVSSGWRF